MGRCPLGQYQLTTNCLIHLFLPISRGRNIVQRTIFAALKNEHDVKLGGCGT